MKLAMTDLETTGIDPTLSEILEIASVLVDFDGFKMTPQGHYHAYIQTDTKANMNDKFVVDFQLGLYEKCNKLSKENNLENVKKGFKNFLKEKFGNSLPQFTGQNFSAFDAGYLLNSGFLAKGSKDKNGKMSSTYNYRSLELQSLILMGHTQTEMKYTEFILFCQTLDTETQMPTEGGAHTALYDCYNQIRFFNGYSNFMNNSKEERAKIVLEYKSKLQKLVKGA